MKNRIGLVILTAALLAPQAALWADAPATTPPAASTAKPKYHGHKHHKQTKASAAAPAAGQ